MLNTVCMLIALALLSILAGFFFVCIFHRRFPKDQQRWFCEHLGWHDGEGNITGFDGASIHATCSICGKAVMLDSQGNWF
jgi:hypothetical protein